MNDIKDLLKFIREYEKKFQITEDSTKAEILRAKLLKSKIDLSEAEYLQLEIEVGEFLKSDASKEEKEMILGYTESLVMICNAIREGKILKLNNEVKSTVK